HPDIAEVVRTAHGITAHALKPGIGMVSFTYRVKTIQRLASGATKVVYQPHHSNFKIIVLEAGTQTGGGCYEPAPTSSLSDGNFGSIAVSQRGNKSGVSCNAASKAEADQKALKACESR